MKKDWTYKKLGEVFKTYAGGTPSKINKANYENGTIPWIRSGEVCKKYITGSELFISEEGLKNSSAKYYPINTVLVAMYGATAAQSGILKFEATSNQAVCGILPQNDFLPEFVYDFFTYIKDDLASQAQGGAQPNISQEKIKNILFPCIPLSEQKEIVSRLDAAFGEIEGLKAKAEVQLCEARALFQAALTKEMKPKQGWEEKKLKEITTKIGSGATPLGGKKVYIREGVSLVRSMNVHNNTFKYDDLAHINDEAANQLIGVELKHNDVLFNITGASIARCCVLPDDVMPARVNQHVSIIRPIVDIINPQFLCLCLLSSSHQKELLTIGISGSTRQAVTKADLEHHIIPLPPLPVQQSIVSRLDALSEKVRELEEAQKKVIAECDALKQALLREVFE